MTEVSGGATPTNRNAMISLATAILTIVALCTGVVPIPLTGFVCFPIAAVLGTAASVLGFVSLAQIRRSGERGRPLALAGVSIGGAAGLGALCLVALGLALLPRLVDFIRGLAH